MTGMPAANSEQPPVPEPNAAGTGARPGSPRRWPGIPSVQGSIWLLENLQDVVTVTVGLILVVLAGVLLVAGLVDFANGTYGSVIDAGSHLLDDVLLVLILVEIVHTVVLSLRSHRLVAQPFIVVGLIAVIRRILFVLNPVTNITVSTSELALLIAMVAVFVASLIAVNIFEKDRD